MFDRRRRRRVVRRRDNRYLRLAGPYHRVGRWCHPTSVRSAEIERSRRKRPESLDAYDFVLRAYPSVWSLERTANVEALKLLGKAVAAWCHAQQVVYNWSADPEGARAEALRLAQMATAAGGEDDPTILTVLGA